LNSSMNRVRPGKPHKPPLRPPRWTNSLGLQDSSSLVTGQQVNEKKAAGGRQERHMQNVLHGTGQRRQSGMQQQAGSGISSRGAGPLLGRKDTLNPFTCARTHTYTRAHTHTPKHTRSFTRTCTHIHTRTQVHNSCTHVRTQPYTHAHTHITHAHIRAHTHARTRTHTHMCTHAHVRAHTCVHMHVRAAQRAKGPRIGCSGVNN